MVKQKLSQVICKKNERLLTTDFIKLLVVGPFESNKLKVVWKEKKTTYPKVIQKQIDETWAEIVKRYPKAFSGPLVRLDGFEIQESANSLTLYTGPTNYKDYTGTKQLTEDQMRSINYELAHPLGVVTMIFHTNKQTGVKELLIGVRSNDLAHHPGGLEFPGGNVDINKVDNDGKIDPISSALMEIEQEVGIRNDEISNIKVIGLAYERYKDAAPVLILTADFDKELKDDLTKRSKDGEAHHIWILAEPEKLIKLITEYMAISLPVVQAGVFMYLDNNFPDIVKSKSLSKELVKLGKKYSKMSKTELQNIEKEQREKFTSKVLNK